MLPAICYLHNSKQNMLDIRTMMISNENANGDDNDHDRDENNKMNVKII